MDRRTLLQILERVEDYGAACVDLSWAGSTEDADGATKEADAAKRAAIRDIEQWLREGK